MRCSLVQLGSHEVHKMVKFRLEQPHSEFETADERRWTRIFVGSPSALIGGSLPRRYEAPSLCLVILMRGSERCADYSSSFTVLTVPSRPLAVSNLRGSGEQLVCGIGFRKVLEKLNDIVRVSLIDKRTAEPCPGSVGPVVGPGSHPRIVRRIHGFAKIAQGAYRVAFLDGDETEHRVGIEDRSAIFRIASESGGNLRQIRRVFSGPLPFPARLLAVRGIETVSVVIRVLSQLPEQFELVPVGH